MTDISKISNGTNTYDIKDATARSGLSNKQDTLVSGTNIKTINNQSILGSGNINIQGSGSSYIAGTGIDITNNTISIDNTVVTTSSLATVATSGSYNDLNNKPTIPDITNMQTTTNLVTSVSSSSTDSQYPSAKLFYDTIGNIETVINTIRGV